MDNNNNQVLVACVLSAAIDQSFTTEFCPRNESTTAAQMSLSIRAKNALASKGVIFEKISFRNVQENKLSKVIIVEGAKKNGKSVNTSFTISVPGREEGAEVPILFKPAPNDAANHLEPISSFVVVQLADVLDWEQNKEILHTLQDEVIAKVNREKFGTIRNVELTNSGFKIYFSQFVVSKSNSTIYRKMATSVEGHVFGEVFTIRDISFRILYWRDNLQQDVSVVNQYTYSDVIAEEYRLVDIERAATQACENELRDQISGMREQIAEMQTYEDELQAQCDAGESRETEMQEQLDTAVSSLVELQASYNEMQASYSEVQASYNEMQVRALHAEAHIERGRLNLLYGIATQQAMFIALQNNTQLVSSIWNPAMQWWEFSQENGGRFSIGVPHPQPIFQQPPLNWGGDYQANGMVYYHPPAEE